MGFLLAVTVLNIVINGEALYLRAHKQEKFLLPSILGALLVAPSTYFLGRSYGSFGIVTGSLAIGLFMGLPLATYIFIKYRRIWHEQ
jgi:ABC-type Co2+ transport system permease subunit